MCDFFDRFEEYCKTPEIDSGKARSYRKAIEYLCDYLKISNIDTCAINQIKSVKDDLCNKASELYKDFWYFLEERHQKSYLSNGFVRAALCYLFEFTKDNL